jgi:O-antigen ligase
MNSISRIQRLPIYTAALTTIVVIPALLDPINLPKLWILSFGAGLSFAVFSSQILSIWKSPNNKALPLVSLAFVFALLISSIASKQEVFRTLVGVWGRNNGALAYFALFVIFLSLATMRSDDTSKYLINALVLLGILFVLYGWIQITDSDVIDWENPGNRIILTLGNSDFASAFFALTAIGTLTMILQSDLQMWKRAPLIISFLVQIYMTFKSDALQGFLALLLGSAILIGLWLAYSNRIALKRFAIVWWANIFVIGVLGITGLFGSGPLSNFMNPNLRSLQDRYYFWVAAMNMMKNNLFFGVGIDSYGDYYRKYRTIEGINLRGTPMTGTNNAHNTVIQIGATGGLMLLFAYLSLIVFTGYRAIAALRKSDNKVLVSGILSIWIAFQLQSMVSIDQIGLVVWGWASAGCLVALSNINPKEKVPKKSSIDTKPSSISKPKNKFKSLLVLIGILPSILLIPTIQNEMSLRNHLTALLNSDNLVSLKSNGREVVRIASISNHPELRLQAFNYLLKVGLNEDALALIKKNTLEYPNSFDSWNANALIYEQLGEKSKAISYRTKSVELDPLNSQIKKLLEADMASD